MPMRSSAGLSSLRATFALEIRNTGRTLVACGGGLCRVARFAAREAAACEGQAARRAPAPPAVAGMATRLQVCEALHGRGLHHVRIRSTAETQGSGLLGTHQQGSPQARMAARPALVAVQAPDQLIQALRGPRDGRRLSSQSPEQGSHSPRVWTVPNAICMARIAATPGIAYLVVLGHYDWAFCGLVVAGLSDGLDGYIARNFDQKSVLGSYLDPFSDKILINSLALACASPGVGLLPGWVVGVIFLRDASLIGAAVWVARARTKERGETLFAGTMKSNSPLQIKASMLSKVNTVLQLSMLAAALGGASSFAPVGFAAVVEPIAYATACTTAVTMLEYVLWPGYHQGKK